MQKEVSVDDTKNDHIGHIAEIRGRPIEIAYR